MTDGQFFVYVVAAPETAVILTGRWAWRRLRLRRARTAWIRRLETRRLSGQPRRPAA